MDANSSQTRKRLRAEGYDYFQPAGYFVTICVEHRRSLLGHVVDGILVYSPAGTMVVKCWESIPEQYPFVEIDAFVVMPNHMHGVITLQPVDGGTPPKSLPEVVAAFKSITTIAYKRAMAAEAWEPIGQRLWQRSFHDRVIRGDRHLERAREYVEGNPGNWARGAENPEVVAMSGGGWRGR
jgi:putative transposase